MTTASNSKLISRTEIPGSKIDDELVFFNHETGMYYGTGQVGAEIWEFLDEPRSMADICDRLLEKFEVDRDTCEKQVHLFIEEMVASGILDRSEQG